MAHLKPLQYFLISLNLSVLLSFVPPCTDAISFDFPSFGVNQTDIILEWDAQFYGDTLYLTYNPKFGSVTKSLGKALYRKGVKLWEVNGGTKRLADFTTRFSFQINDVPPNGVGHGLTFLLFPEGYRWFPDKSDGRFLGLFKNAESGQNNTAGNQVVAIEFDTHRNPEWKDPVYDHMGIDVNSIESKAYASVIDGIVNRGTVNVVVTYVSTTKTLKASLAFANKSLKSYAVSHVVDLSVVLPERVQVGFTAATATLVEVHELYSWSFYSSLDDPVPPISPSEPSPSPPPGGNKVGLVVGVALGLSVAILISGVAFYWFRSRRKDSKDPLPVPPSVEDPLPVPPSVEDPHVPPKDLEIDDDGVPKRFSYVQLHEATNGFAKELILGKGGFGDVFEGTIIAGNSNKKVAVKKFRSGSNQGETEYVAEVNVISKLRHKNLVQLKGWCHEKDHLILVYEFMPNRSLDIHLYGKSSPLLTWSRRYNIALGLASGLDYLQDGSDPGVVHRDIKSSNIMLDSNFNAKLGDFGLAKLTDHEHSLTPTIVAGTRGYLAPEVIAKGKASKATDMYSYGVVALELASGRKAINQSEIDPKKAELVSKWVLDLYKKGLILEAVDKRLNDEYDKDQARQLLMVGLCCCHPDSAHRPSIKQVIDVLNKPKVPLEMPEIAYINFATNEHVFALV